MLVISFKERSKNKDGIYYRDLLCQVWVTVNACIMLCYVMLCCVMLCYVVLCYAMLCYAMLCYAMQWKCDATVSLLLCYIKILDSWVVTILWHRIAIKLSKWVSTESKPAKNEALQPNYRSWRSISQRNQTTLTLTNRIDLVQRRLWTLMKSTRDT